MKLIAPILIFLLTGCSSIGFNLDKPERFMSEIDLTIERFDRQERLIRATSHLNRHDGKNDLKGMARYYIGDNECTIYVIEPSHFNGNGDYDKTLGHELMHCIYGDYH